MSTIIKVHILILFFLSTNIFSQKTKKDSIYFFFDENYTINSSITNKLIYPKYKEMIKSKIDLTNTNGYIHFFEEEQITGVIPKKILKIKDYIENDAFYFDGKYNKIVDNWKVKKYLLDKYTIFLVKKNQIIKLKSLTYSSFYPLKRKNKYIDKRKKDTLVFKFDPFLLKKTKSKTSDYFILKNNNRESTFGFIKYKEYKTIKIKKTISLKKYLLTSRYYNKKNNKIYKSELAMYLTNYIIFIKTKKCYYKVNPYFEVY